VGRPGRLAATKTSSAGPTWMPPAVGMATSTLQWSNVVPVKLPPVGNHTMS